MPDSKKRPKRPRFSDVAHISLTPEAMLELCREIAAERMTFEERAAREWEKLQRSLREDAELFKNMKPHEIAKILDMRDEVHARMKWLALNPGARALQLRADRDRFELPMSGGPEAVGAEAALKHARELRQRRPRPRADGR